MSQIPETNPELATKGALPDGWTTEYSPQWNAWFYVDTKSANPQAVWTHPLETNANPSPAYTAEATGHSSTPAAPVDHPTNPDTRPLPPGWTSQYNPDHKTFFYVNEAAADPSSTVTWTHPAESHPPATDLKSPATAATHESTHATTHEVTHAGNTGASMPTPAPTGESTKVTDHAASTPPTVPAGWKAEFDTNYKAWYYINTNDPSAGPTWTLPVDAHTSPPASHQAGANPPITTQSSYTGTSPKKTTDHLPSAAGPATPGGTLPNPATGQRENPDKRPLPNGWITKFDENYNTWYYVDTLKPGNVTSWEHPAEKAGTSGAPIGGTPGGYNAGGAPPANQQYGGQAPPAAGGKGIEGLLGGSAGKMVGGLFGAKGRAQMDTFANKLAPEVNKLKGKYAGGSSSGHGQGQGQYGAPPAGASGQGQGQYGAPPAGAPGQYGAPATPGQAAPYGSPPPPSQAPYGSPPPPGQQQYGTPGAHSPAPGQGPPPGQYAPSPGGGYGAPPPGQAPHGQGGHGQGGFMGPGGLGGLAGPGGLNSLAGKFGKFGLGKK